MAIKLPDPGNGIPEQKTGNDEWTNMKIVRDNFADQSNAASRLVGTEASNLVQAKDIHKANNYYVTLDASSHGNLDIDTQPLGETWAKAYIGTAQYTISHVRAHGISANYTYQIAYGYLSASILMRVNTGGTWGEWVTFYSTGNTTKEEGTGYLVASSPVLKMQHDSFEKVHEAEQLDVDIKHIKTGVYEVTGTTGLREGDGWNLKPPKDVNGNVLCICEASEKDGVISLKTYKKKFDFETVSIVADYEQPTNIPEGATVMLRFNDLPQEQLDEPIE